MVKIHWKPLGVSWQWPDPTLHHISVSKYSPRVWDGHLISRLREQHTHTHGSLTKERNRSPSAKQAALLRDCLIVSVTKKQTIITAAIINPRCHSCGNVRGKKGNTLQPFVWSVILWQCCSGTWRNTFLLMRFEHIFKAPHSARPPPDYLGDKNLTAVRDRIHRAVPLMLNRELSFILKGSILVIWA